MPESSEELRVGLWANPWLRTALYLLIGYVGLVLMLVVFENRLIYFPTTATRHWLAPPSANVQDVHLTSADGTRIHGWWYPYPGADEALLFLHGNAGNLSHRGVYITELHDTLKASVLIIDYPGYGKSNGTPNEQSCILAGEAAYAWLKDEQKIAPHKIMLFGESLGGGVAVELASRLDHRALILMSPFTSIPDVASDVYWWLPVPVRMLARTRFDNLSKIGDCRRPVFICHGTGDRLIGHAHGEKLFDAANEPKQFCSLPGADHNDRWPQTYFTLLRDFLHNHSAE